jgi:hypothetical protein
MNLTTQVLKAFFDWYNNLPVHKASGGAAKGTIGNALVVLERLKEDYNLDLEAHRAPGGSQIKGASGAAVAKILAEFGETRPYAKEGGRTNRGGPGDIRGMLEALGKVELHQLTAEERNNVLAQLQELLVEKVREFHNRQRLTFIYDPSKTTRKIINELLMKAKETGKEGPVAQYLVGAKLQLRFPDLKIGNESYSTADDQLGRPGDFLIGATVFHVTVAPMPPLFDKCKKNIDEGFRVYLLVPEKSLSGARYDAEAKIEEQIAVESIETFISQNVEELSYFSKEQLANELYQLLSVYNTRVDSIEIDKSLLIEIPKNLGS